MSWRLVLGFCLIGAALGLPSSVLADEPRSEVIGTSQGGTPLTMYELGNGTTRVLLVGGQHGGPEENAVELAGDLLDYFIQNPEALPTGLGLDVLPVANPDGLADGQRQFLSGVDPNRNWGGADWRSDAYDSNGQYRVGLGGPEPFSEQETRALADWILAHRPAFVVDYHSAGGFMFGPRDGTAGDLASAYAQASGYNWPAPGGRSPLAYSATGSMNVWLRGTGITGILVELSTPRATEVERNLAGVKAVLSKLSQAAS
jgi:Zinc carboxypeptidase